MFRRLIYWQTCKQTFLSHIASEFCSLILILYLINFLDSNNFFLLRVLLWWDLLKSVDSYWIGIQSSFKQNSPLLRCLEGLWLANVNSLLNSLCGPKPLRSISGTWGIVTLLPFFWNHFCNNRTLGDFRINTCGSIHSKFMGAPRKTSFVLQHLFSANVPLALTFTPFQGLILQPWVLRQGSRRWESTRENNFLAAGNVTKGQLL